MLYTAAQSQALDARHAALDARIDALPDSAAIAAATAEGARGLATTCASAARDYLKAQHPDDAERALPPVGTVAVRPARLLSIRTYARQAYANRYAFDSVTVSSDGRIKGHWSARTGRPAVGPCELGHIGDCRAVLTDTGVRFYNRDFLVYTFGRPQ